MTPLRGQANLGLLVGTRTIHRLRQPQYVPQPADPLNHDQRELDHMMRCTKAGCTRCAS